MAGFIQDKLEIKFLILYIMDQVREPIPFETALDLAMCDEGVGYFDFSECMADLVRTKHLTLEDGLYAITDKGRRNSEICASSLPRSVRLRCDRNVDECNRRLRRKRQVRASWEKRQGGGVWVRLALDDDLGEVLELGLAVPGEDMAKAVAEKYRQSPETVYSRIMELLLEDGGKKREE